jgi:hypothetical protein
VSTPATAAAAPAPRSAAPLRPAAPADAPSPDARRAALLLHALPAADREWLLAELPDGARATLRGLVAELEELGIPSDHALVQEVVDGSRATGGAATSAPPAAPARPDGRLDALCAAAPTLVSHALRDEPAGLVATLLRVHDFPWREAVLARLDPVRRRDVEERLGAERAAAPAPALRERLLAIFAERLLAVEGRVAEAPTPRPTWLAQLLGKGTRR